MSRRFPLPLCLLLVLSLLLSGAPSALAATAGVRVYLDGNELAFPDQAPVVSAGRALVPLRFVSEAFVAQVDWDPLSGSVRISLRDTTIVLRIGRKDVEVNNRAVLLDVAPTLLNGRTMVPLRFISEVLGANVAWSDAHRSVFVRRGLTAAAFQNSYFAANFVKVSASRDALTVSGAQLGQDAWVWVMIRNGSGERVDGTIVQLAPDRTYSAHLIPRLAAENYTIDVYTGPERFGAYVSKHVGIALSNSGTSLSLPQSPMYEHNYAQFTAALRDRVALSELRLNDQAQERVLRDLAATITHGISDEYAKLLAIHDWVAQNVYYDYDGMSATSYQANTAYPVYLSRRAVCQGYAELAAALLRASAIPARVVVGHALGATAGVTTWAEADHSTSNHAWNEAFVNGRWVIFDATWNSGNQYIGGQFVSGALKHTFFDITLAALSLTHKIIR